MLVGVSVVAFAIWAAVDKHHVGFTLAVTTDAAYALLAIGVTISLVSFAGCCGAVKKSKALLGVYAAVLLLLMIGEAVVVGLALTQKTDATAVVGKIWTEMSPQDRCSVQTVFKCTGFASPIDRPATMCEAPRAAIGCSKQFTDAFTNNLGYVRGVLIGIAVFQFVLFLVAIYLAVVAKRAPLAAKYTRLVANDEP